MILDFKKYIHKNLLQNEAFYNDTNISFNKYKFDHYKNLYREYLLSQDVFDYTLNENTSEILFLLENNIWESDDKLLPNKFMNSLNKSKYIDYLSEYTLYELKDIKLFKLKGYDIGFGIKNGDILLVHNNSNIKGIGTILLKTIINNGGERLDHFDGFLTGFYKKNGFINITNNIYFDKKYAPKNWNYKKIDINNPLISIYAEEIIVSDNEFTFAKNRYDNGMPDIVYRELN